jgi:hypothetical protein
MGHLLINDFIGEIPSPLATERPSRGGMAKKYMFLFLCLLAGVTTKEGAGKPVDKAFLYAL